MRNAITTFLGQPLRPSAPRLLRGLALCLAVALQACGGGGSGNSNPPPPPPAQATVSGTVVSSADGQPLSGVQVRSGTLSATTDAGGNYTLTNVPTSAAAVVTFDVAGYAPGIARVTPPAGGKATASPHLTPVAASLQFAAAAGATVSVANSTARVTLPAGGLVNTSSGAAANGTVTAEVTPIDPAADPANMPGNFLSTGASGTVPIDSLGAMSVTLRDANGNRLNLAQGQTSTIRIPVATRATSLPATMPLYYLDETTGLWVQQGSATLQGVAPLQYYEGAVGHFSHWNIDHPTETLFLTGCLVDQQNKRVAGADVKSDGVNYSGSDSVQTDANGNFTVGMMRGTGIANVYATLGDQFSNIVQAGPSNGAIALPNCLKLAGSDTPPTIAQQPADQSVPAGVPALFSAQALGSGALSYQWRRDGSAIPGAMFSRLVLIASDADNNARFSVVVTNAFGSATSNEATLTVTAPLPPAILTQPADQNVQVGATATFSVTAAALGQTLTYQWLKNGSPIPGATGASYTTPATSLSDDGTLFSVVVTGSGGGSTTSNTAKLGVSNAAAPRITSQPQDLSVTAGQTAQFSVVATGTPAPTYQWSRDGVAIASATSATYTTPATTLADSGATFTVTISNSLGSVTSNPAHLTVTPATGGSGYYHIAAAGPITNVTITYANGGQTVPSQALMAVPENAPGSAVQVEASGGTTALGFTVIEATISSGAITNARNRISPYFKDGRFWTIDQLPASGAPTPQRVSTITPADVCGSTGLPMQANFVDGSDWADASRSWVFMRTPGSDGICNTTDDTFLAVRLNMGDTTAPVSIGEPLAQIRGADGSFAGLIVRNGNQVQQLNADLGTPTNLFTVTAAAFVNGGSAFGSAPPGLWLFVDGSTVYAVNLQTPGTRAPVATLATGETLMSHLLGDGAAAYFALNTASAGRVLRVTSGLSATQIMTLSAPAANLALSSTRVVVSLNAMPVSVVSALKTASNAVPQTVYTAASGDLVTFLLASGENVYLTTFGTFSLTGSTTVIAGSDGTSVQTLAGARIVHGIGPETMQMSQGLNRTYAVILVDGEASSGFDAGATLRVIEGATRNALATYGTFPSTTSAQAVMFSVAPMQFRETALVDFIGGTSATSADLYFIKSDAAGMQRITNFLP